LLVENRWLDRLKILTWHPTLAAQKDVQSACCRLHLRVLVARWMNQASLRLSSAGESPLPITSNPVRSDLDLTSGSVGQLVGELSVYREAFSRGWTGSPTGLEFILDALIPPEPEIRTYAIELQPFSPLDDEFLLLRESLHRFVLHQSAGSATL